MHFLKKYVNDKQISKSLFFSKVKKITYIDKGINEHVGKNLYFRGFENSLPKILPIKFFNSVKKKRQGILISIEHNQCIFVNQLWMFVDKVFADLVHVDPVE